MHCDKHGDFDLMPVSHYRREPCPQCNHIIYAKEALTNNWATIGQIAEHYGATVEQIRSSIEEFDDAS